MTATIQRTATFKLNPVFRTYEVTFYENDVVVDKKGNLLTTDKAQETMDKWVKQGLR